MPNVGKEKNYAAILFDGHGQDARYNGPLSVAPTISATYGMGGGNIPLVLCAVPIAQVPTGDVDQGGDFEWPM